MPLGDVSFDYDMALVRDDQRAILQKNADYLRRWTIGPRDRRRARRCAGHERIQPGAR